MGNAKVVKIETVRGKLFTMSCEIAEMYSSFTGNSELPADAVEGYNIADRTILIAELRALEAQIDLLRGKLFVVQR